MIRTSTSCCSCSSTGIRAENCAGSSVKCSGSRTAWLLTVGRLISSAKDSAGSAADEDDEDGGEGLSGLLN